MSKKLQEEIQELRGLKTEELEARYTELHGKAPHVRHREWMWKRCAWKIQERRYGGLSRLAQRRLEELVAELDVPHDQQSRTVTGQLRPTRALKTPKVGTRLVRHYLGRDIVVDAREDGFEHEGQIYRSLTAAARAITGSRWNGRLFFGLTSRKKKSR